MQSILGWLLIVFPGALYAGQLLSSVNFPLAQRLGLQEDPAEADPILQRAEKYTAFWDLVTLLWLPVAGILMLIDSETWPLFALLGGAIYLDAAGREAVKVLSLKHEGIRVGTPKQYRLFYSTYFIMGILGGFVIYYSVGELWSDL